MTTLIILTTILFPLGLTFLAYALTDGIDFNNDSDSNANTDLQLINLNNFLCLGNIDNI